ncbi:sodium:calcium antiporter [Salinilacihabitans rarus]|uniref:sodium:calcium antiporter n=1 Tax=Salinilacihabitans rarus TaxID=2961596 RepID=UPI0020C881F2|nr:sodium:calcium antiporter [Salinilacihabitans rarus]
MASSLRHPLFAVVVAVSLTVPWLALWTTGTAEALSTGVTVLLTGIAILGAAFLLAWAAETAEKDVPRSFAIAVLAVLAVAPEYAVDALYAWTAGAQAGTERGIEAGNLAIANMTGANRILIGLGWSAIALFTLRRSLKVADVSVRHRDGVLADSVVLDRGIAIEILFLGMATVWAFFIPLMGGIDILDTIVLVGLYVLYIAIILKAGVEVEEEHIGVPAYLQTYARPKRVATVIGLFAYSGVMLLLAVEAFAHGLEGLGVDYGIPKFFMIQWVAPLASESPELIVVAVLVLKSRSTAGFNALISSKLNQWTLLIGTLAVVYSLGLGQYGVLEFEYKQALEIWLTAAQSFFALAILVNFEISGREAVALLALFSSQVTIEFLLLRVLPVANPEVLSHQSLLAFTAVYVLLGTALFVHRRRAIAELMTVAGATAQQAIGRAPTPEAD